MKKHILIVDDEAEIREMLVTALGAHGYRTTDVATAIEAEKAAGDDPPDLIISDLQLEDSDGLKLVERLKTKLPDTPILLLTGVYFEPAVVRDVLSKWVAAYLYKTVPLEQILRTIDRLSGRTGD
jgi:CheY-like chemotaxis protein